MLVERTGKLGGDERRREVLASRDAGRVVKEVRDILCELLQRAQRRGEVLALQPQVNRLERDENTHRPVVESTIECAGLERRPTDGR